MRSVAGKIFEYVTHMENQSLDGVKIVEQSKNSLFLFTQMGNGNEKLYCLQNVEDPARSEVADKKTVKLRFENVALVYIFGFNAKRETVKGNTLELTLSAGETVGRVEYYLDDRLIKTSAIYSVADMYIENKKETLPKRFFDNIKAIWNNS